MFRRLCLLALLSLSTQALAASAIFGDKDSQAAFDQRLAESPVITRLKAGLPTQCAPADVELHYKKFNVFNSPDLIVDWQFHYVVAPASKPKWRGSAVADVAEYSVEMDDARALAVLQAKASELGGCAVTTIFREPVTLTGSDTHDGSYQRSRIIGYVYYGKIIRRR
jgi:hypothetical protein